MYYRDIRALLDALDAKGLLYRFREPIDKDKELLPFYRLQLRGLPVSDRKVMLFDRATNSRGDAYSVSVLAGVYSVSDRVMAVGLGCDSALEMLERVHHGLENRIDPVIVSDGAVHEEIHVGNDLLNLGLDELPVPVEEPGLSQAIRTGMPMITKDPETGVRNVGTYNAFLRDRNRMISGIGNFQQAMHHWRTARRLGQDLPVAILIGALPNVMLSACANLPYGEDELALAGGIAGAPVELVRCKTVPLEVPANAEMVIEGVISTSTTEPRLAFGEYPGYMCMSRVNNPVITVTAITHRRDALFTPILVGFPPSDNNALAALSQAAILYHHLRYVSRLPVAEVYMPQMGGGSDFALIRLEKDAKTDVAALLHTAAGAWRFNKYMIVVDHDIDPRDAELVQWALTYRVRPECDISIRGGRMAALDPSTARPEAVSAETRQIEDGADYHRVLIDATMKGPYPPVSLPDRQYMERALNIWRQHADLPELHLRDPWYGYRLGWWTSRDQELADLIASGDYKTVGRMMSELQQPIAPTDLLATNRQS